MLQEMRDFFKIFFAEGLYSAVLDGWFIGLATWNVIGMLHRDPRREIRRGQMPRWHFD
jgi:hypothetical protein